MIALAYTVLARARRVLTQFRRKQKVVRGWEGRLTLSPISDLPLASCVPSGWLPNFSNLGGILGWLNKSPWFHRPASSQAAVCVSFMVNSTFVLNSELRLECFMVSDFLELKNVSGLTLGNGWSTSSLILCWRLWICFFARLLHICSKRLYSQAPVCPDIADLSFLGQDKPMPAGPEP